MADPYQILQQGAANTNAYFANFQRSLIQSRELQLQEQAQVFNQGIQLKSIDLKEKELQIDTKLKYAQLGIQQQQLSMQDEMNKARVETEQAHANLYDAQTWKIKQLETVAPYFQPPINGSATDYISSAQKLREAANQTLDPALNTVLNQVTTSPPKAPAYRANTGLLPALGSTALGATSGMAFEQGAMRGLSPEQDGNLFASTPQAATPVQNPSGWNDFNQSIELWIQQALVAPKLTDKQREAQVAQLQQDRLNVAQTSYAQDPAAQPFLNQYAYAREAVKNAVLDGDDTTARKLIQESLDPTTGLPNPAYVDTYNKAMQTRMKIKEQERGYAELESILKLLDNENLTPTARTQITQRAELLQQKLFTSDSTLEADADTAVANGLIR